MKTLPTKLRENHHRRIREELLLKAPPKLSQFLASLDYSSDVAVIANAAFSTWSTADDDWTTTRGLVKSWEKFDFPTWTELTSDLSTLSFPTGCYGWLFFDSDGPYFRLGSAMLHEWLDLIADFALRENSCEFAWVGDNQDFGLIIEFEHTSFCKNDFTYCAWTAMPNKPQMATPRKPPDQNGS
jgi:hypothetical protein